MVDQLLVANVSGFCACASLNSSEYFTRDIDMIEIHLSCGAHIKEYLKHINFASVYKHVLYLLELVREYSNWIKFLRKYLCDYSKDHNCRQSVDDNISLRIFSELIFSCKWLKFREVWRINWRVLIQTSYIAIFFKLAMTSTWENGGEVTWGESASRVRYEVVSGSLDFYIFPSSYILPKCIVVKSIIVERKIHWACFRFLSRLKM